MPVLLDQVVEALAPRPGSLIVDATFGGGGYSRALLAAAPCRVLGIDRDPSAAARGRELAAVEPRFTMVEGPFGELEQLIAPFDIKSIDGLVLDLGVSSFQLDDPGRGFSFQRSGPLDMRMAGAGPTAAELLAGVTEPELTTILRELGDEPDARRIARAVVARREREPLLRTDQLADLIVGVKGGRRGQRDPATRSFQAIRMWVNDELGELDRALLAAERLLAHNGVLAVVSFHSGEDGRVKRFVDGRGGKPPASSRHAPPSVPPPARWAWRSRGIVRPTEAEVAVNPRARSARLRVALRQREPKETESEGSMPWRLAA